MSTGRQLGGGEGAALRPASAEETMDGTKTRSQTDTGLLTLKSSTPSEAQAACEAQKPEQPTGRFYQLLVDLRQAHEKELEALRFQLVGPQPLSSLGSTGSEWPSKSREKAVTPIATDPVSESVFSPADKAEQERSESLACAETDSPLPPVPRVLNPTPPPLPPSGLTAEAVRAAARAASLSRDALTLESLASGPESGSPSFQPSFSPAGPGAINEADEEISCPGPDVKSDGPSEKQKETEGEEHTMPGIPANTQEHAMPGIPANTQEQRMWGRAANTQESAVRDSNNFPTFDRVSNDFLGLERMTSDDSIIAGTARSTTPNFLKQTAPSFSHAPQQNHLAPPAGDPEDNVCTLPRALTRSLTPCKDYSLLPVWRSELTRGVERKISFSRRSSGILHPTQLQSQEKLLVRSAHPMQCFVLHPSSLKRLTWDLLSMSLLAYDIMVIPFVGAFDPPMGSFLTGMTWGTLLFWTCDMPLSMLTGYQKGKHTILAPGEIIMRYLKTWFALDVLIIFLDWTALVLDGDGEDEEGGGPDTGGSVTRLGRTLRTLRFVRTLRLIRVLKLKRIVQAIQDSINTEAISIVFGICKIISCLIVANHIVACGWYAVAYEFEEQGLSWVVQAGMERRSLTYRYMTSLHWSLTQFTPASMEVAPQTTGERIYTVVVILFAMIAFSSFVSILTASMAQLQRMSSNESRQFWLLRRYLRDWNVRRKVGLRVQRYLEYAYQKQKGKVQEHEVKLLALLSEPLRLELKHETFSHYLSGHPLFQLCSEQARVFGKALAATSMAQGDIIFACGEKARRVTFLTSGMLEYTLGVKVDCNGLTSQPGGRDYILEGMWCCEAVLWTEWHHLGDLQAMTECQVITVDAKQFGDAVQVNAPIWMAVRKYAENFIEALNGVDLEDLTDLTQQLFSPNDAIDPDDFLTAGDRDVDLIGAETRISKFVKFARWIVCRRSEEGKPDADRSAFSPPTSPRTTGSFPWGASKVMPAVTS